MRRFLTFMALVALALAMASPAKADSIGPNCATCQGSIYTLTYNPTPVSTTATTQTFQITFTINTAGYNGGGSFIDNIAIKVSSSVFVSGSTLVSAPGGVSAWTLNFGGLNANGCSGSGSGFECADATVSGTGGPASVPNGIYTWVLNMQIPTGTLFTSAGASTIKARYVDNSGNKVGALVSESITLQPVPEPGTLALFGTGLIGVARLIRRRLAQ